MAGPVEILVDARGHLCPVPTLKLRRALELAPPGAVLCLVADDPMARIDVPHFAAQAGLDIVSLKPCVGGGVEFRLRRASPSRTVAPGRARRAVGGNDAPPG